MKKLLLIAAVVAFGAINLSACTREPEFASETYTVKAGDTVWTIAEHYRNVDTRNLYLLEYKSELEADNPFIREHGGMIYPGDKILVRYAK